MSKCKVDFIICMMAVLGLASSLPAADALVPLPVVGAEFIDGSMVMGAPSGDPDPTRGSGRALRPNAIEIALDYLGRSVVVDLGQIQLVQKIEVCSTYDRKLRHLNSTTLELYQSIDNLTFTRVKGYRYNARGADKDDYVTLLGRAARTKKNYMVIELSGLDLRARYLKVHSGYKGREYDFVASPDRMIRAFGRPGVAEGDRVRLPLGLLHSGANTIHLNTAHFEDLRALDYQIRLVPLDGGPAVFQADGEIVVDPRAQDALHELKIDLPDLEPGLYRLSVNRHDPSGQYPLWTYDRDIRFVSAITYADGVSAGDLAVPGECVLIRPGTTAPSAWSVDVADPDSPLWRGKGDLSLACRLKGSYAVYVGHLGSQKAAAVSAGTQQRTLVSSKNGSAMAINESYYGILDNVESSSLALKFENQDSDAAIAWIKLLALTPRQVRLANGEEDLSKGRKLIYVSDGSSWFGGFDSKPHVTVKDFEAKAESFIGSDGLVERFDWCPGSSTVIYSYPTKVAELIGKRGIFPRRFDKYTTENVLELIGQGNPPLRLIAEACRRNGLGCYAAIRMASFHTAPYEDIFNSEFWKAHPEYRIVQYDGRQSVMFSYAFPEVRKMYLDLMREMLDYSIDGIHFEFLKEPMLMGFEEPLVSSFRKKYGRSPLDADFKDWQRWYQYRADIMTGFVRSVRAMLDEEGAKCGRRFGLSARIPCYNYFEAGLDPKAWIAEGLVDMLAPGTNQLPNHPILIEPFIEMARGTSVKIYSRYEDSMGDSRDPEPGDDEAGEYAGWHSAASVHRSRDFIMQEFRKGAAGIYRFNSEGADWRWYQNLERWDEFENPRRLLSVPYTAAVR
jgi:hypothetical protein